MVVRRECYDHGFNQQLSTFAHNLEHATIAIVLLLLGGLAPTLLPHLTWPLAGVALALLLVVRPVIAFGSLCCHHFHLRHRLAIAFFGVRGIGTIYYLAYAAGAATFTDAPQLWATGLLLVLVSSVLHGITAVPAMRWVHACEPPDNRPPEDQSSPD
jgi:NhaP-type Na+/H+ or K+/H+ antiporter